MVRKTCRMRTAMVSFVRLIVGVLTLAISSCSGGKDTVAPVPPMVFAPYAEPAWHPGGQVIYFNQTPLVSLSHDPNGHWTYTYAESLAGFWLIKSDGTGQRRVLPFKPARPKWNAAGTLLAYEQNAVIWTIAGSDTGMDQGSIVQVTAGDQGFAPTWSPTGTEVAYSVNAGAGAGIYKVPATGGISSKIGDVNWREPDWSPDGARFAFIALAGSGTQICIADTSGQGLQVLWGSPTSYANYPRWSPDGSKIAFSGRTTDSDPIDLWVVEAGGSGLRRLTTGGVQDFFSWSPDGTEIAYVRYSSVDNSLLNGTVWIINIATSEARQLTLNNVTH